jgi:uncharacterized damage-inducible protein DinB
MKTDTLVIAPPDPSEHAPYYGRYISLVPGQDILAVLPQQIQDTRALLSPLREEDGNLRYAPGKWSVKQVLGHLIDSERIFCYRALRIARGDQTPLPGFEQDDYVRDGPFEHCRLADLVEEFDDVRKATVDFFRNLDEPAWSRWGTANEDKVTVRATAYIIAGHELHHWRLLQEKYLSTMQQRAAG